MFKDSTRGIMESGRNATGADPDVWKGGGGGGKC